MGLGSSCYPNLNLTFIFGCLCSSQQNHLVEMQEMQQCSNAIKDFIYHIQLGATLAHASISGYLLSLYCADHLMTLIVINLLWGLQSSGLLKASCRRGLAQGNQQLLDTQYWNDKYEPQESVTHHHICLKRKLVPYLVACFT